MRHAGPVLVLAVATVALTWPLAAHLTDQLPAFPRVPDDDLFPNIWSLWWTRQAWLEGHGRYWFTRYLFAPEGVTLTLHAMCPVASVLVLPILARVSGLAGLFLAWNVNVLATFFLSGLGAYGLAYRVTGVPWAALVAGLVFAFSPYRYDHLRHVNLSCTQWIPFVYWALIARLEGGGAASAVALAAAVALVAGSSTTYVAQLPLFGLVFFAAWSWTQPDRVAAARRALLALVLPVALVAALALPLLAPALVDMATLEFETPVWEDPVNFAFPIEGFVLPNRQPYVGIGALGLSILAVRRAPGAGPWAAVAFLGLSLAPGPVLKTLHGVTRVPLPYALVRYWPGLTQNRFTERFLVYWWLGAAVLVAMALARWAPFERTPRRWGLLAGALLMVELCHAPLQLERPAVPSLYETLAEAPPGWPVYEWPADYLSNRRYMYYQLVHQRPICQGLLARRPIISYQLEASNHQGRVPRMILVLHKDWPAEPHQKAKLEALKAHYAWRPFRAEGQLEAHLLELR